jgi:hypothetical protein
MSVAPVVQLSDSVNCMSEGVGRLHSVANTLTFLDLSLVHIECSESCLLAAGVVNRDAESPTAIRCIYIFLMPCARCKFIVIAKEPGASVARPCGSYVFLLVIVQVGV